MGCCHVTPGTCRWAALIGPAPTARAPCSGSFSGPGTQRPRWPPSGKGFRWSRHSVASVVLPSLGAGIIDLRLELMAPFRQPLRAAEITLLHQGMPLAFNLVEEGRERATLATQLVSADEGGLGSLAIVLQGPAFEDPSGREKRGLGLGLHRIVAERA